MTNVCLEARALDRRLKGFVSHSQWVVVLLFSTSRVLLCEYRLGRSHDAFQFGCILYPVRIYGYAQWLVLLLRMGQDASSVLPCLPKTIKIVPLIRQLGFSSFQPVRRLLRTGSVSHVPVALSWLSTSSCSCRQC